MMIKRMVVPLAWGLTVAILGGLSTDLGPWYQALKEPFWKPPDIAFGPIWSTIFILSGVAWVAAKYCTLDAAILSRLNILFWVNGLLNILWSVLYFRLQRPDWSLYESVFLWLSVLAILLTIKKISPKYSLYMLPHLIWVSIAIVLNWDTVRLNGPFT
ncbi:tryptophan-rich sensory protein [Polynucleobacter sp. AP-Elch-400A-B2]|uniref:TspO/MBR family protein n=1 Tax=Polynucleobacter sp. AP-Elch-400A-B2 TaxID=2576930 RepID=UPI001BFD7FAE|nr:TspO/MBR family protein [Polynucleobacter sp. AP-Elch-400A-B2]QWE23998.1 tryptophan-rich sensory protein [Polynucleobacter sp. AP-Elch-400A-B2]